MGASDIILVGVVLFVFGIGGFLVFFAANEVTTEMLSLPALNSTPEVVDSFHATQDSSERIDYLLLAVFIGLSLGIIITGYLLKGHPIFMGAYFLVIIVGVILSAVFSNVWSDVTGASIFGSAITSFPITNHLLGSLPYYIAAIGIIGIIVMFFKPQEVGY